MLEGQSLIFLPQLHLKIKNKLEHKIFSYSKYPNRIEIHFEYNIENYDPYLEAVACSIGDSLDRLKQMLDNFNRGDMNRPVFIVSLPMVKLNKKSFCAHIYYQEQHFSRGILKFNESFGQFPITLTQDRDLEEANKFYKKFDEILREIQFDRGMLNYRCPRKDYQTLTNHVMCELCMENNRRYR